VERQLVEMVPWNGWGREEREGMGGYIGLRKHWGSLGIFHIITAPEPSEITASVSSEITASVSSEITEKIQVVPRDVGEDRMLRNNLVGFLASQACGTVP
jgi:hypothetical protein